MRICGVDDAGRGPVIGPLVIAGIVVDEDKIDLLKKVGVKDSKLLRRPMRERLDAEIRQIIEGCHLVELSPSQLDTVVHRAPKLRRLNYLEALAMAEVIEKLRPERAFVDASDVRPDRFGRDILSKLSYRPELTSEHEADRTYPVVSAASILAKVRRDRLIDELKKEYGDFGSGYVHDVRTIDYLEQYYRVRKEFPPIVRRSWMTLQTIVARLEQVTLGF